MNTQLIEKRNCKLVAHRGASGLEQENTCPAFVAAAVKTYYGIETDVHVTADGKFVLCHDSDLYRTAGVHVVIEETNFDDLRRIPLLDKDGKTNRTDLFLPVPEDYFSICKKYGKVCVFELKERFPQGKIAEIVSLTKEYGVFEQTYFISFCLENLTELRTLEPNAKILYLTDQANDETFKLLKKYGFGLDIYYGSLYREYVERLHRENITVACWTVDKPEDARALIDMGVDIITSNILE